MSFVFYGEENLPRPQYIIDFSGWYMQIYIVMFKSLNLYINEFYILNCVMAVVVLKKKTWVFWWKQTPFVNKNLQNLKLYIQK